MNVEPSIFKAYDIRGLYPGQLTGEVARRVGRAFVDYLGAKRIVVGHDARLSSPEITAGFIRGARTEGATVVDIGCVGTDMMYFFSAKNDLDGGAIITASHNPKDWNGIKMVRKGAYALSGDAGIKEIKEAVLAGRFADDPAPLGPEPERRPSSPTCPRWRRCGCTSTSTAPSPTIPPTPWRRRTGRRSRPGWWPRVPTWASPGTAMPTAASSWTTKVLSCPAIS